MQVERLDTESAEIFRAFIPNDVAEEIRDSVKKTKLDDYIGNGFAVYGLFREYDLEAQGALVVQLLGTVASIRSLYVAPEFREYGGGTMLVERLVVDMIGVDGIEEIEFMADERSEGEKQIVDFLRDKGFICEEAADRCYVTTVSAVEEAGILAKYVGKKKAVSLSDVSDNALRVLGSDLIRNQAVCPELPINRDNYEQTLSKAVLNKDRVEDLVLIGKTEEDLILSYAYSGNTSGTILTALAEAMKAAVDKYGEDKRILIPTVTKASSDLTEKIIPGAECCKFTRCYMSMLPLMQAVYGNVGGAAV